MLYRVLASLALALLAAPLAADDVATLVAELEQIRDETGVPAFAFTLADRNTVLYANASGVTDLTTGKRAGPDTRFRIGSVTKTFTGLALLIGEAQGHVTLAARFRDITGPGLITNPWAASAPVTLAQLLEHTAGLSDLTHEEMYHSDPSPLPLAEAVRSFRANRIVRWQPGLFYSYSNAGAGLAAYALEVASGIPYETFIQREIFDPLGMQQASLLLDDATRATLAHGYDTDRRTRIPYWHMLFRPFGAINVTAADMAPLIRMLLNDGVIDGTRILPAASMRRLERSETSLAARHGLDFGYGIGVYSWYHGSLRFFGHGGDGDGYLAHLGYSHDAGLGYSIIINAFTHRPLKRMRRAIEDFIRARSSTAQPAAAAVVPESVLPPAGPYAAATRRFGGPPDAAKPALFLEHRGGGLFTRRPDSAAQPLLPVGRWTWRRPRQPGATVAIMPDAEGRWIYHGERENFVRLEAIVAPPPAE